MTTSITIPWAPYAPGAFRRWAASQAGFARAALLRRAPPALDLGPAVGEAWFPVVFERPWAELEGCLLCARTDGAGIPAPRESVERVWAWIAAIGVPVDPRLRVPLKVSGEPGAHEAGPLTGRSLELALALAAISRLLGRPPRQPAVASACLGPGSALGEVDRLAKKAALLAAEDPELALLTPQAHPADLLVRLFGPTWAADLAARVQVSPERLADDAFAAYGSRKYPEAEAAAQASLRAGAAGFAAGRARWIVAAMHMHRGDTDAAMAGLRDAGHLIATYADPDDAERERLDAFLGVALIDLGRPRAAIELLEAALQRLGSPRGEARRLAWIELRGTLSRAFVLDGRLDDARAILEDNGPARDDLTRPTERARNRGDLAEVYRRMGDYEAAAAWLDRARADAAHMPPAYAKMTLRFLDLYAARCGDRAPDWPIADADQADWPQPLEAGEAALAADPATFGDWLTESWGLLTGRAHRMALGGLLARALLQWPEPTDPYRALFSDLAYNTSQADGPMEPELQAALLEAMDDPSLWIERSPY